MSSYAVTIDDVSYSVDTTAGSGAGASVANGKYSVMDYGAVGDGTTDDTTAIQAAIDAAEAAGAGEVYFPPLTFRTAATLVVENTNINKFINVNLGQATIVADSGIAGPIIRLGGTSAQHYAIDLTGGHLKMATRDWVDTVGVQLSNLYNSHVKDFKASGCEKGVELSALSSSDGTAYNTLCPRHISDCLYGIYLENDGDGWVNENCFYGDTRVSYSSALADVDCSGGAGFYAKPVDYGGTSAHAMNSHSIFGLSLEFSAGSAYDSTNGHKKPPAVDVDLTFTTFAGVRTEGWDTSFPVTAASQASPCVVTIGAHGIMVGDNVRLANVEGMVELDGDYAVEAVSATTISLTADASGFTAYTGGGTVNTSEWLQFGPSSSNNIWYGGRRSFGASQVPDSQRVRCNFIGAREHFLGGGSTDYPVLSLRTNSGGYLAFGVYNANSSDPGFWIGSDGAPVFVPKSAPSSPAEGMVYYDSAANKLKVYTGSAWETVTSA